MRKVPVAVGLAWALAMLTGSVPAAAGPVAGGPAVGDRLAPYAPSRSINAKGKLVCQTC